MPSNQTPNYQLSQWERDDRVLMEDFNADNAKIDTALKAQAATCASLQTLLNKKGNCSVGTFTYQGTGTYGPDNPTRITFPRMPIAYIIAGYGIVIGRGGANRAAIIFNGNVSTNCNAIVLTWSGNTMSFHDNSPNGQMNNSYYEYTVIGLYSES